MKKISLTIALVAVLGLLAYTNPPMDAYQAYVHRTILEDANRRDDDLAKTLGIFLGGIASSVIAGQTIRKDYVFFSTYDTNLGNENLSAVGVLNNFVVYQAPESLSSRRER